MTSRLAVFGLTAGLLGGGAAGLLATGTTLAGAQTDTSGTTGAPTAPSTPATPATPAKGERVKSALAPLVANGTITQAQADAVIAALDAARPAKGPGGKGGRHAFKNLDAAARALGMTVEDLRTALVGGKSLATIAGEKGVAVSAVVDALVADLKAHLDEHVASGRNTQAEADRKLANARTRIEAFVNGTAPAGGPGFGFGKGGRHGRGPVGAAPSSSSSSSSSVTTS